MQRITHGKLNTSYRDKYYATSCGNAISIFIRRLSAHSDPFTKADRSSIIIYMYLSETFGKWYAVTLFPESRDNYENPISCCVTQREGTIRSNIIFHERITVNNFRLQFQHRDINLVYQLSTSWIVFTMILDPINLVPVEISVRIFRSKLHLGIRGINNLAVFLSSSYERIVGANVYTTRSPISLQALGSQ